MFKHEFGAVICCRAGYAGQAVTSLYKAFNTGDTELFGNLLDPNDPDREMLIKGFDRLLAAGVVYEHSDLTMDRVQATEDMTRIRAHFRQKITVNAVVVSDEESGEEVTLVKQDGRWYFTGFGQWPPPGWLLERTPVPYATPTDYPPSG